MLFIRRTSNKIKFSKIYLSNEFDSVKISSKSILSIKMPGRLSDISQSVAGEKLLSVHHLMTFLVCPTEIRILYILKMSLDLLSTFTKYWDW